MTGGFACTILACAFSVLLFDGALATPIHRENIPLNAEVFAQPEYVEALAKELEKEGVAALKNHDDNGHFASRDTRNDIDGYGQLKKYNGHSSVKISNTPMRFTDRIIYPSDLFNIGDIKRNFDEIDRSGFSGFYKRNFDEIDRNGFSGFSKRNFDEIDRNGFSGFNKRNFDEIDRNGFSGFNKRNLDEIDRNGFSGFTKRNLDEIDRNGFSGFHRKRNFDEIDRTGFSGFNRKRNFDEIDRTGFSGFNRKRNFDEIDRSGVPGFTKRSVTSRSKLASHRRR